jgi:hypothetical protein
MAVPDKLILYNDDNTQLLQLFGLSQELPGTPPDTDPVTVPVVAANVKATLKDGEDLDVPGCINISLTPMGSPPAGDYSGTIGPLFDPVEGTDYILVVTADNGPDHLEIEIITEVKSRRM